MEEVSQGTWQRGYIDDGGARAGPGVGRKGPPTDPRATDPRAGKKIGGSLSILDRGKNTITVSVYKGGVMS